MGAPSQQFGTETLAVDPNVKQAVWNNAAGFQNLTTQLGQQANQAYGAYGTNFQTPQLNTEFQGPNFSNSLDAFSKNLMSQSQEQSHNQLTSQQQQLSQQFRSNPAVAQILQAQSGVNSQLGQNPAAFQAGLAQRLRESQEYQLGNQAQAQTNEARLGQANAANTATGLHNQALGQQLQIGGVPVEAQQNLVSMLSGLASLFGSHVSQQTDKGVSDPIKDAMRGYAR